MKVFKNKGIIAEGTTHNKNINNVFGLSYKQDRLRKGFDIVALRELLAEKYLNKKDIILYKKELNEKRKNIAQSYDDFDDIYYRDIEQYYADKYLLNFHKGLGDSEFKYKLELTINHNCFDFEYIAPKAVNFIGDKSYHRLIKYGFIDKIRERLFVVFHNAFLLELKNYTFKGKYAIKFGYVNFADNFNLSGNNDYSVKLTLPHSYKTDVLGTDLEVIDKKYLTISLKKYHSIIVDCEMYQAEVLKVVKPFMDSQLETINIAKIDDVILYAKTNQQLTKKVVKYFEDLENVEVAA